MAIIGKCGWPVDRIDKNLLYFLQRQKQCEQRMKILYTFKAIDNPTVVTLQPLNNGFGVLIPHKDIAAITAAHNKLGARSKEIDTFYGLSIPINRI